MPRKRIELNKEQIEIIMNEYMTGREAAKKIGYSISLVSRERRERGYINLRKPKEKIKKRERVRIYLPPTVIVDGVFYVRPSPYNKGGKVYTIHEYKDLIEEREYAKT